MVECLPEVEAQPQPLLWCPSGDKSVVLLKFSLLLPDPSTCQQTWGDYFEKYSNTITNTFNFHDYEYDYDYTIFKSIRLRL